MTDIEKRIELEALITEREGMKAENQIRTWRGEALAYDEGHFNDLAERMRKLNEPTPTVPAKPKVTRGQVGELRALLRVEDDWYGGSESDIDGILDILGLEVEDA